MDRPEVYPDRMVPAHRVIPGVLAQIIRPAPLCAEKVEFAWRTSVGPAVSRATTVRLNDTGVLTITAPGATNTPQTVTVNLTVTPPPFAPCDFDQDHDVDLSDFGRFQKCMTGGGVSQPSSACAGAKLDGDDDVDADDFAVFDDCLSGPDVPAITTCAD